MNWPQNKAIVDVGEDEEFTYEELRKEVDMYKGRLADLGVSSGDKVEVISKNRYELVVLLYAVREMNATLAPVSYRLGEEAVSSLTNRIEPEVVLVEEDYLSFESALPEGVVRTFKEFSELESDTVVNSRNDGSHPVLFIHTSGTTGVPKIVPISDDMIESNCVALKTMFGFVLNQDESVLNNFPLYHSGGWIVVTLSTLYAGATLILQPKFDVDRTLRVAEEYEIPFLYGVPAMHKSITSHDSFSDVDLSSVRFCMSGGGPCHETVIEAYQEEHGLKMVQSYGLTEGGPNNMAMNPLREDSDEKTGSVGKPMPGTTARLVDEDGNVVEGEGSGELELKGPVTASGYLDTEEGIFNGEWVKTEDVAERDENGDYYIVGRTDNMFVSGGENIYPEDIEEVLEHHEDVKESAVIPITHEKWGKVPKAIIVGGLSEQEIVEFAEERLAGYKVPNEVEFVGELPRSTSGKVKRGSLEDKFGN